MPRYNAADAHNSSSCNNEASLRKPLPSALRSARDGPLRRACSVHFSTEPVARDVQREMERELQQWISPALEPLFHLTPNARGACSVRVCWRADGRQRKVVLKTVAMTLPPNTRHTTLTASRSTSPSENGINTRRRPFASTEVSSGPSADCSRRLHSEQDSSSASIWSNAQLLPDVAVVLFEQANKRASRCVASVVDVFTLATMLRATKAPSASSLSDGSWSGDMARVPHLSTHEMELRGWAMNGNASASVSAARMPSRSTNAGEAQRAASFDAAPLPPHPTVFVFAREYIDGAESLDVLLQERWGRDRLPITVMPAWAHATRESGTNDRRADAPSPQHLSEEKTQRLVRRMQHWTAGRATADLRKLRFVEQQTADETERRGAVFAALVSADEERLSRNDAADIVWSIADALEVLHRGGQAHGNLKPCNVFVRRGGASVKEVCLTDHLLPIIPDALLEPGAVLTLPGWHREDTVGYVCLKAHDASVVPHVLGGGAAGSLAGYNSAAPSHSISGCWLSVSGEVDPRSSAAASRRVTLEGGVDAVQPAAAYEAIVTQHFVAPENVLLVRTDTVTVEPASEVGPCRLWVKLHGASPEADVYALGVLLWVMLVGRLPPLPQYRQVNRLGAPEGSRQLAYAAVMAHAAAAAYQDSIAQRDLTEAAQAKRMRRMADLLASAPAQANLPLVMALLRAGVHQPAVMDLLLGLLHTDPQERLTLAELRHHWFFHHYGSRLAGLRHSSTVAARGLMPRQMGALVSQQRVNCRSTRCAGGDSGDRQQADTVMAWERTRRRVSKNTGGLTRAPSQSSHGVPAAARVPLQRSEGPASGDDADKSVANLGPALGVSRHLLSPLYTADASTTNLPHALAPHAPPAWDDNSSATLSHLTQRRPFGPRRPLMRPRQPQS